MSVFRYIVKFLVIIGALEVGIMGATNYDVISSVFGMHPMAPRIVFIAIGIAGVLALICLVRCCCGCKDGGKKGGGSCSR